MCSPASTILASIVTKLVSFEAILKMFSVRINFKSQIQSNDLLNNALAGEHIFQVFAQYS